MPTAQEIEAEMRSVIESPQLVERLVEYGKESVRFWLPEESLAPIVFIAAFDAREKDKVRVHISMVDGPFNGHEEKQQVMEFLARQMHAQRAIPLAILLASEAWRSKEILNQDGSRRYALPEDDPQREELITLQVLTAGGKGAVTASPTVRRDGKLHLAGEWEPLSHHFRANLLSRFFFEFLVASQGENR